jgi:poly-gamma-glutamate synthase PgsB/CapB
MEDGREEEVRRRGRPRIREQLKAVSTAAERRADALVLECMAIQPELQHVSEHRMFSSTIGVITNIREDHLEVMGPALADSARAMCLTIPEGGVLVTGERLFLPVIKEEAERIGTRVVIADPEDIPELLREKLPPLEMEENVALSLKVCQELGVKPEQALEGMLKARPDPGALKTYRREVGGRELLLVNAFAANDPSSTRIILEKLDSGGFLDGPVVALFNNRRDRMPRAALFSRLLSGEDLTFQFHHVILMGPQAGFLRRQVVRSGLPAEKITTMGRNSTPRDIMGEVAGRTSGRATVIGMGNLAGAGQALVHHWEETGESRD